MKVVFLGRVKFCLLSCVVCILGVVEVCNWLLNKFVGVIVGVVVVGFMVSLMLGDVGMDLFFVMLDVLIRLFSMFCN